MVKTGIGILLMAGLISCGQSARVKQAVFFDLAGFVDGEVGRLEKEGAPMEKTLFVNGREDRQEVDEPDYAKELSVLRNADINRPAWSDLYRVDSLWRTDSAGLEVAYTALDSTLKTREMVILWEGTSVKQVRIRVKTRSLIARTEQEIEYDPQAGYKIDAYQKVIFYREDRMQVAGSWGE